MPRSTITSKRQTTDVPKKVNGGRVAVTTERLGLWRWKGFIKHGPDDAVKAVHEARKRRGRI